jgi:thermosome
MNEPQSRVVSEHVSRMFGREAQRNNILAAKLVADIVKTTLGPRGMDKMLVDRNGNIVVTNDGVTILEEMELDHPAAKMMVDIAKTQESEVGDGTTTAALLAGKLLEYAEHLLERRIHPTIIVKGYRLAAARALEILQKEAQPLKEREQLRQIAMTAMTGKGAEGNKEHLANLIVEAAEHVGDGTSIDLGDIAIEKLRGASIAQSELVRGLVMQNSKANSEMPSLIRDARILLIDFPLELRSPEGETKISVSTPEQLENFIASEERQLRGITETIIASGASVVFCQKGIDDVAQYYLAKAGVFACRRVPRSTMEKIARATSGKIITTIHDLDAAHFGVAASVEEVKRGSESYTYINGCQNPKAVSIIVRGGSIHALDEVERALRDGLGDVAAALASGTVVAGGGAIEVELARQLALYARTVTGREQLAINEFAHALEAIPETLAENAGLDSLDILAELKRQHDTGFRTHGLNLFTEKIEDTLVAGIVEPLRVKTQAISSASEVASLILRIDDVLMSKEPLDFRKQRGEIPYSEVD